MREASAELPAGVVELFLTSTRAVAPGIGHPSSDLISFGYVDRAGTRVVLDEVDARYLSNEIATSFTGRVFGVYARTGSVAVERIDYQGDSS